jgi:hypothetical protein
MRRPGKAFGPGRRISTACPHAWHPVAALGADGGGVVAWRAGKKCDYGQPCDYSVDAAPIVQRRLRTPRTVSDGPVAAPSPAAAAGGGRTLVVWRDAAQVHRTGALGRVLAAEERSGC